MRVSALRKESVTILNDKVTKAEHDLVTARQATPIGLWTHDLDVLDEYMKQLDG